MTETRKSKFFYGYIVAITAFFIMVLIWGTYYSFGIFFKPVSTEFGWTRAMTSGAFSLSMIMYGLLGIVMGGLNDRLGPRLVMTFCGFFLGLGYLLMSQTNTIWQLYLFYGGIIGIGMGGSWVPLTSTIARWFVKRRSMVTGIVASTTSNMIFGVVDSVWRNGAVDRIRSVDRRSFIFYSVPLELSLSQSVSIEPEGYLKGSYMNRMRTQSNPSGDNHLDCQCAQT